VTSEHDPVIDAYGMAVSATCRLEQGYEARFVDGATGRRIAVADRRGSDAAAAGS
jgi:hypothetical protein